MKKTLKLFAILAVLLFAASCQNSDIDNSQTIADGSFTVTATIVTPDATRVSYDVDNASTHTITPAWTVGDKIIGFDNDDHTFTFTVSEVDGSGRASLDLGGYSPGAATKLYAIYYPGKTVSNFSGSGTATTLAVDLSTQDGAKLDDHSPVLMCATADINAGSASLDFENQTAIIGVTRFKLPAATTVTSVAVAGLVTTGTFKVEAGALVLTPDTTPTTVSAAGSWTTGEGNICETPLYFATLSTNEADIILNASDGAKDYANLSTIANTNIVAGNYYYMAKNFASAVADVNGVKYVSIDAAWTAANSATSDVTITLLEDCSAAAVLILDDSNAGTGAVTLDLNGKDLSLGEYTIRINDGRSLTIKDNSSAVLDEQGEISSTASARAVEVTSSALTVQGGSIHSQHRTTIYNNNGNVTVEGTAAVIADEQYSVNTAGSSAHTIICGNAAISSPSNAVLAQSGAHVEINGSPTISATNGATVYANKGTIDISGGTITRGGTTGYAVYAGNAAAVVNISGGTFSNESGTSSHPVVFANTSGSVINVTGGSFQAKGVTPLGVSSGTINATGGIYNKPVLSSFSTDGSTPYVNILNTAAATKGTYPFTLVSTSSTPQVATTAPHSTPANTCAHGTLQSAAKAVNIATAEQDFRLTTDVEGASRVNICSPVKTNLYFDDHTVTSSVARAFELFSDVDIYDGPLGEGGVTNTAAQYALVDTIAGTKLNIYGGNFKTAGATYGALRFWGKDALLTIDGNPTFENTGAGAAVNIGFTSASSAPRAEISGGTFISGTGEEGYGLRCGYGVTHVTGGTFVGTVSAAYGGNFAALNIHGGYFHNGESTAEVISTNGSGTAKRVDGGWFSKAPAPAVLATNYVAQSGSETVDGRTYSYEVVFDPTVLIAQVNGVNYYSFYDALDAALDYDGAEDTVTLKLLTDVEGWSDYMKMDNTASKPIVFDLNGHTFGTIIDSLMTTTGVLTITDASGSGVGKFTSNKRKQIYLAGTGTINITDCTVECTRGGYYAIGPTYKMIAVAGTGTNNAAGRINISNAKIVATSYFSPFHATYGSLTFTNSEITCGTKDVGGNYCIDVDTGGSIVVDNSSFVTFPQKSNGSAKSCIYSRTGNIAKGSSIIINSGWFYGGGAAIASSQDSYSKPYTLNGGYFNSDFTATMTQTTFGTGLTLQSITPVGHNHGGTEYSYGYQVK